MSLLNILKRYLDDQLAEEGITPQLLEMIDLSIAHSPVIPFRGGTVADAVEVRPWDLVPDDPLPERFNVRHPLINHPVDRESLKIMRARYLLARAAYYEPILHQFHHGPVE